MRVKFFETVYNWLIRFFGFIFALCIFIFFMLLICSASGCAYNLGKGKTIAIVPMDPCLKVCEDNSCSKISRACAAKDKIFIGPVIQVKF